MGLLSSAVLGFSVLVVLGAVAHHAATTGWDSSAGADESDDESMVY